MNQADEAKFKDYTDRVLADLNSHRYLLDKGVPGHLHSKALTKNGSRAQLLAVSIKSISFTHFLSCRILTS